MGKRAAIYCRISLDKRIGSSGEGEGVERQERLCHDLCRMHGYEVSKVYVDNSISAHGTASKASKERPQFEQMMHDFEDGNFDVIVAWKLDRLTRSNSDANELIAACSRRDGFICTTDIGEKSFADATSNFMIQVVSAIAEWESSRKSERYKALYSDRAANGIFRTGPNRSYGYTRENKIIREEAKVVKFIYEAYDRGSSINAITRALRGEDDGTLPTDLRAIPTRVADALADGKEPPDVQWSSRSTGNILRNPKYAGYIYHAPTRNGKHASYNSNWRNYIVRDEDGDYKKAENVEPIVDEALWWRVQERRDKNLFNSSGGRIVGRGGARKNLGARLYVCHECGKPLVTGGHARRGIHDYGMSLQCPNGHLRRVAKPIDDYVKRAIRARLARPDLTDLLAPRKDPTGRLGEIAAEVNKLNASVKQTEHDYDNDLIEASDFNRKVSKLRDRIDGLMRERASLTAGSLQASIVNAPDPVAAFDELTDPRQTAEVIDFFCTVRVKPHPRGKRVTFASLKDDVLIEWKEF